MNTTRKNSWTEEEDNTLLSLISNNLNCLKNAFIEFHNKYPKRSTLAAQERWYKTLRLRNDVRVVLKREDKHSQKNVVMVLISKLKKVFL